MQNASCVWLFVRSLSKVILITLLNKNFAVQSYLMATQMHCFESHLYEDVLTTRVYVQRYDIDIFV